MSEDRDHRRRRTPPSGVRAQIAPQPPESWDDDQTPPPVPGDPEVPSGVATQDQLVRIGRRVKLTTRTTLTVLDLTNGLRRDLDGKLDVLSRELAELRASSARNEGKLGVLVEHLEAERQARRQFDETAVASLRAGVEVTRTRALSEIEIERSARSATIMDLAERRRYWRDVVLKIFAGVAVVWGLISTILLAKCGVQPARGRDHNQRQEDVNHAESRQP